MAIQEHNRQNPLARPAGHKPPVPRWTLIFPPSQTHIYITYIGIQPHDSTSSTLAVANRALNHIRHIVAGTSPASLETFSHVRGHDTPASQILLVYHATEVEYDEAAKALDLRHIHASLDSGKRHVGLWIERFSTPVDRVETNYTGTDYLPGLARLPGTSTEGHTLTAYWGAARDRIPEAAKDLFEQPDENITAFAEDSQSNGLENGERTNGSSLPCEGKHLTGTNYSNMVHIRSGQFWENCNEEEARSYEEHLEPFLMGGLNYLWDSPSEETGTVALRFLRNTDPDNLKFQHNPDANISNGANGDLEDVLPKERKETCASGFFRNLRDLERWSSTHSSHHRIYAGAMKHARTFGSERKFRTWHEVVVLREGDAQVEYLNCLEGTGGRGKWRLEEV